MANDKDRFVVGYVSSPHPHAPFHVKTLELLDSVEAVHFCGLEGEDTAALAAATSKAASTFLPRMVSTTRRTFLGDIPTFLATALTAIALRSPHLGSTL